MVSDQAIASSRERFKSPNLHHIDNGDQDTDADCMSSVNQGPCWDAGDTLGWGKAPGSTETSAPWTPSMWKAPSYHNTLKEQEGLCHHQPTGILPLRPARPLSCRTVATHQHRSPPATGGLQDHQTLAPNLTNRTGC
jgi:hypothetical protein